jgi:hypothetical protein
MTTLNYRLTQKVYKFQVESGYTDFYPDMARWFHKNYNKELKKSNSLEVFLEDKENEKKIEEFIVSFAKEELIKRGIKPVQLLEFVFNRTFLTTQNLNIYGYFVPDIEVKFKSDEFFKEKIRIYVPDPDTIIDWYLNKMRKQSKMSYHIDSLEGADEITFDLRFYKNGELVEVLDSLSMLMEGYSNNPLSFICNQMKGMKVGEEKAIEMIDNLPPYLSFFKDYDCKVTFISARQYDYLDKDDFVSYSGYDKYDDMKDYYMEHSIKNIKDKVDLLFTKGLLQKMREYFDINHVPIVRVEGYLNLDWEVQKKRNGKVNDSEMENIIGMSKSMYFANQYNSVMTVLQNREMELFLFKRLDLKIDDMAWKGALPFFKDIEGVDAEKEAKKAMDNSDIRNAAEENRKMEILNEYLHDLMIELIPIKGIIEPILLNG